MDYFSTSLEEQLEEAGLSMQHKCIWTLPFYFESILSLGSLQWLFNAKGLNNHCFIVGIKLSDRDETFRGLVQDCQKTRSSVLPWPSHFLAHVPSMFL